MTETVKAVVVPADIAEPVRFVETTGDLDALQGYCGGVIEAVGADDVTVYLHEEGKILGFAANARATVFAHRRQLIRADDYIAGDVVVLGFDPEEGDHLDIPAAAAVELLTMG